MRLGVKHQNQFQIVHADFSGGLNTSTSSDGIAENQLARATNVEVDHATGKLRTVAGTIDVLKFKDLFAAMYDDINKKLLLVKENRSVYAYDLETETVGNALGVLSGELYPLTASWEDGLLIASGGKLQYFNGQNLLTLKNSPISTAVYVRAGRVLVSDDNNLRYSSVGDEETWTADSNDESIGVFVEAGYKDGGKLIAMVNLSSDVLMIKDNRRVYRLSGDYPDWSMNEVSRNVEASGRLSVCAVSDSVFVLGRNELQNIQTTADYGDVKPQNVATLIEGELQNLPENALLRFIPKLNQLWAISGTVALIFDLVTQSWYKRQFNSPIVDVISVQDEVYIIKPDRVSKLEEKIFYDSGEALTWTFQCKRRISSYEYFLKKVAVSFMPLNKSLYKGQIRAGAVIVELPVRKRKVMSGRRFTFSKGEPIFKNHEPIKSNPTPIYNLSTIVAENVNVYRSKFLDIIGRGSSGGIIFNSVTLDLVEV